MFYLLNMIFYFRTKQVVARSRYIGRYVVGTYLMKYIEILSTTKESFSCYIIDGTCEYHNKIISSDSNRHLKTKF